FGSGDERSTEVMKKFKNRKVLALALPRRITTPTTQPGSPDHSYAIAVLHQTEKIREMTDKDRNLEDTLDVAQKEFGRHVQEAFNAREAGKTRSETVERISQGSPSQ